MADNAYKTQLPWSRGGGEKGWREERGRGGWTGKTGGGIGGKGNNGVNMCSAT